MTDLLDDIIQALKNLGGQAKLQEIYSEVKRITKTSLSATWQAKVRQTIEYHSSDSMVFKGKDYFHRVSKGTWALRNQIRIVTIAPANQTTMEKKYKESSYPETFEAISNYLRTIKEYREYSDPASSSWIDYIQEVFHVLGFSTERKEARLIFLKSLGGEDVPRAIVGYVYPAENFEEIIPGLKWDTYLSFAASYYHVEWGVLTNGLQMTIFNYGDRKDQAALSWSELDGIIVNQKVDSFFPIYKALSLVKDNKGVPLPPRIIGGPESAKRERKDNIRPLPIKERGAYQEVRDMVKDIGGTMYYEKAGHPLGGAWIIRLGTVERVILFDGSEFPEIDHLYIPKPGVTVARHWRDYSIRLIPNAREKLLRLLSK